MEAALKTRKLDAREEVWWSSSCPETAGAAALPQSATRYSDRRPRR
jgi:hypothetical protein